MPRKLPSGEVDVPHNAKWSGWYSTIDLQTAVARVINIKYILKLEFILKKVHHLNLSLRIFTLKKVKLKIIKILLKL